MDPSARLSTLVGLEQLKGADPASCDMLVSAFASAVTSGRRATVCKPFPSHLFGQDGFDAAAAAVQSLSMQQLQTATDVQLQLLQWLLLQLQRTWVISFCTASQILQDLQHMQGHSGLLQAVQQACCVFQVMSAGPQQTHQKNSQGKQAVLAFHGTDFSAMHSILQQGLLAASGTRLQTTGAVFGQGIYLSTDFTTAFQFTKGRPAWQHSMLGRHLRCVLVCEVAEAATVSQTGTQSGSSLPTTYIVAPKPSDVRIRFLLVFSDDALLGHATRVSTSSSIAGSRRSTGAAAAAAVGRPRSAVDVCWFVTCAYVAFMVLFGLWKGTLIG